MTVAPPIFLIGVLFVFGFLVVTLVPGVLLLWLGIKWKNFKVTNPLRTVYLIAAIAIFVLFVIALPQMLIASIAPDFSGFFPPYLVVFFIVGFIVFSIRKECDSYGKFDAVISGAISMAFVLWYLLVELAIYAYIAKT